MRKGGFMKKTIICYFSATGTTKNVALELSKILNADTFCIEPVTPYTSIDLDWTNKNSRSSIEMADENSRPEVKNKLENINEYRNVIIGFPVWWYKEPTIIDTFIEENDLTNKNVYVFVTSGGSTFAGSLKHLKEKYSNINFISGKTLNGRINNEEIESWVK